MNKLDEEKMQKKFKLFLLDILHKRSIFLTLLIFVVLIVMSFLSDYFLTFSNLLGMLRFGSVLALVSLGQGIVKIGDEKGLDISVGSMVSFCGVILGLLLNRGLPIWLASILCIMFGGLLGAVNGWLVAYLGLIPLIATLGTMWVYESIPMVITGGVPVSGFPDKFNLIASAELFGIPLQILLIIIPIFILVQFILTKTRFGRWVYQTGENEKAARFVGLNVKSIKFSLYILSGMLSGVGAIIMTSWLMGARPDVGLELGFKALTVVALGGLLAGGGNLATILLGVLVITMLQQGFQLANINTLWQLAILGILLIISIAMNEIFNRQHQAEQGVKIN